MKRLFTLVAIILAGSVSPVFGQDSVTGQYEYMNFCAGCHGIAADGKGPLVTFFKQPVPDLTVLAKANDGEFPFLKTMMIIDGRTGIRGHGGTMPIWGDTFAAEAVEKAGVYGAETIARGRLLSLVEYLATVQQD
ncbi:MAG: cytochrome c [Maritimibacter sp.]|nr:cytochrome c [Maritimibacter sp.]